ncbi:Isocitrate dehydrogenase [Oopsacas minuta]|uniref:Isocitrate dehydrogenase [NAD] subunit, mitochondrial n=1 Tax=Oopsacas minuta TaxID=111878 RepID=A0AAV7JGP2_9METZ|nr:Isocitrate dehydrogenase [Oopsacas minuta]
MLSRECVRFLRALPHKFKVCQMSTESLTKSQYGGRHTVTLIPGDGVGPELAASVKEIFRASKVPVDFEEVIVSGVVSTKEHTLTEALSSINRNGIALKGVLHTPLDTGAIERSLNVQMRLKLDLFANIVYCKSIAGVDCVAPNLDLVIIRENTEGEYSGLEHESIPGVVEYLKVITRQKSLRIAKFAFDFANRYNRKLVTAIHKANIMKLTDGLFLRCCEEVSKLYPNIKFNHVIVDNCCMQLVTNPYQFDVMVMPNLYGNIVSNIGAGLIGGAGIAPGENIGNNAVIYEPGARHTYKTKAFQNVANPTAMLLSSTHMLKHLGLGSSANLIETAIYRVYKNTDIRTMDLGGDSTMSGFVQELGNQIEFLMENPAEIRDRTDPFY